MAAVTPVVKPIVVEDVKFQELMIDINKAYADYHTNLKQLTDDQFKELRDLRKMHVKELDDLKQSYRQRRGLRQSAPKMEERADVEELVASHATEYDQFIDKQEDERERLRANMLSCIQDAQKLLKFEDKCRALIVKKEMVEYEKAVAKFITEL